MSILTSLAKFTGGLLLACILFAVVFCGLSIVFIHVSPIASCALMIMILVFALALA